ncbi:MAG: CVNH domain-containing protein [Nostoc sp.]
MRRKFLNLTSILGSVVISVLSLSIAYKYAQAGSSSYPKTCWNERIFYIRLTKTTKLSAVCRNKKGLPFASEIVLRGINNKDGKLIQNPLVKTTSFFPSCTAINVQYGLLSASCRNTNGTRYKNNAIQLEEISNHDGQLTYEINKIIDETADKIGHGHAYPKHSNEFATYSHNPTQGVMTKIAKDILNSNATNAQSKPFGEGKRAFWGVISPSHYLPGTSSKKGTLVIVDPDNSDAGTMFVPSGGLGYYNRLK